MNTQLDKLIGLLEKARAKECPSCGKQRLQAQVAGAAVVPLAEILGLGAALKSLYVVLSPAAAAAISAGASSVPMTPNDVQQLRLAQTLVANANLSTFDAPTGFSFAGPAAVSAPFDVTADWTMAQSMSGQVGQEYLVQNLLETNARLSPPDNQCKWLRDRIESHVENHTHASYSEFNDEFIGYEANDVEAEYVWDALKDALTRCEIKNGFLREIVPGESWQVLKPRPY
jgi:hypothetical protein